MKYAVLTSAYLNNFQAEVLKSLLDSNHKLCGIIIDNREAKPVKDKLKKNLVKGRGGYVLVMAFKYFFRKKKKLTSYKELTSSHIVPVHYTKDINSTVSVEEIKSMNAAVLVLLGGFGILKSGLLNICKYGVISYHHGNMKKYRGQPPGFWEVYNNEKEMGVTVQKLSEGLDCGEPVIEANFLIHYKDSLSTLQKRIYNNSNLLMLKALDFLDTQPVLKKLDNYGTVYTLPNLRQWIMFNFKILFRKLHLKPKW